MKKASKLKTIKRPFIITIVLIICLAAFIPSMGVSAQSKQEIGSGVSALESTTHSAASIEDLRVMGTGTDDYYVYTDWNPGVETTSGVDGYIDTNGNLGDSGAEYIIFAGGISEWGDQTAYIYRVETAGDPNMHPDNPDDPGPIALRTFTLVSSHDLGTIYGHTNAFYIDDTGIYYGARYKKDGTYGGIYHWDFDWTPIGWEVATTPPESDTPSQFTGAQTLARNPNTGDWWTCLENRKLYKWDGSSWVYQFTHPSLGGGHHDGLEIIGDSLFVSDMTSDVIAQYRLDASGNVIDSPDDPYKMITYTTPGDVEGMGYGPNKHIWISGWSSLTIYEIGGGELLEGISLSATPDMLEYAANEIMELDVTVTRIEGNPLYPLVESNFKVFVDGTEVNIEDFNRISATYYEIKVKAPQTVGDHSIVVRADTVYGWGSDIVEIKVYKISSVSLTIGGNRLTQYQNSADTPIYYRGDSNVYPKFEIDVEVDGATFSEIKDNIQVFANISDYTKVEGSVNRPATYDSGISKYKADWKNSPNDYPVGEYNVTAEVKDLNGNPLAFSERKHFYLIFKTPSGYESFITSQISAEIHHAYPAPDPFPGAGFIGTKFNSLHQFEYRNWKNTLDELTGPSRWNPLDNYNAIFTRRQAIGRLTTFAHGIDINGTVDDSYYGYWHMDRNESLPWWDITHLSYLNGQYIYGSLGCSRDYASDGLWPGQNAWWWDVNRFKDSNFNPDIYNLPHDRPVGVCADYAPLLISHARSAGIPAREIVGFFAGGGGHAVTEAYYDNKWHHCDPTWNDMEEPWTYSDVGYYWTSYKTSSNSPWSVFPSWATQINPGTKTDVVDRKDSYNYIAKAATIHFDKTDYDYPDHVNLDITVENTGSVPITEDYLHLLIFDKPTIARLGPTHLRCDIPIVENLNVGETETYNCPYQLPDYGILNGFYELIGDRYVVAEVHYYNSTSQPYHSIATVTKVEARVEGLCDEWNPQMTVDDLTITLGTTNSTSLTLNETTNESTETFVEPQNASVTVEHKIKCSTNYTREIWDILNPNNNTHDYSLTTPLLGIGNAVYILGYGSITANQSIDISADYIVIYNITVGTSGLVDIYAFSKNMTLKDVTLFNGVVKVIGIQNCTLASESGESYLTYLSTRNGSGMSFNEIYSNFAQEIVSDGDTLTQFFIEGEHEQIYYYKVGDTVYVSTTISNNGIVAETRNLSLVLTEPGVWNSENIIYNTTETVTIPAKSGAGVTFQYQIPDSPCIGKHRIIVSDDITKATTIFNIQAPFNVTFDVPATVTQAEEFYVNATITNALNISLSGINVTIELPNDFNTSDGSTKNIETLLSGESSDVSWLVNTTDFEYGYAPITFYITSAEGIKDIATTSITVLRLPELKIFPSAPSEVQINTSFEFKAIITNEGDLNISGVSVNLSLPDNVTVTDDLTKLIGDLAGGETKSVNWTITSMQENDFWIKVNGCDVNGTYCAYATELINIVRPEIELDLISPAEVIRNQSFSVIAKIENVGELNATQVKVNLSLPPELETVDDTFVNIGDLSPGQTKEVEWTLKGVNPGYGDITVNVTLSDYVSITKGVIVTYFPLSVETDKSVYMRGDNVKIPSNTTNENPEVSYVDLVMNLTIQGPNITVTYDKSISYIQSLESLNVTFTWDTTGKTPGDYIVTSRIMGSPRVLSEASTTFTIELLETDLPNVELVSADPTVTYINVTSLNLSEINETHKPENISPQSAYMINSTGAGNFTLQFTNITNANTIIVYKLNATNYWIELDTTATTDNVTFTMSVGDPPVVFASGAFTTSIDLYTGWNLISLPLNLSSWVLGNESVVGDPLNVTPKNSLTSIYRYSATTGLFEKCDHLNDWGWWPATGAESFTNVEHGRGYWVWAKNDCNLTLAGTAPSDKEISLGADWNLIGWYSLEAALLGQESVVGNPLNVTPKNSLTSIYRYNSSTGLFEKSDHLNDWGWWPATGSESFTALEHGSGYWVWAENGCVWRHEL